MRDILFRQGRKQFGAPNDATAAALNAISDVRKLEELSERVLEVGSWQELLQVSTRRRRNGRRQATG
jgi:hypothetical protein